MYIDPPRSHDSQNNELSKGSVLLNHEISQKVICEKVKFPICDLFAITFVTMIGHTQYIFKHTSAIEPMLKNDIVTVFKTRGKRALADVNCYCKTTSVVALDGVT